MLRRFIKIRHSCLNARVRRAVLEHGFAHFCRLELLEDRTLLNGIAFQETLLSETAGAASSTSLKSYDLEVEGSSGQLDLFIVDQDNGFGGTTVSIWTGESDFQTLLHSGTPDLGVTDNTWEFDLEDWNNDDSMDLIAIHDSGTGSGMVEFKVFDGSTFFITELASFETGFTASSDPYQWTWDLEDWDGDNFYDLVGIQQNGAGNSMRALVMDGTDQGSGRFNTQLDNVYMAIAAQATAGGSTWDFDVDDFDDDGVMDVVAIGSDAAGFSLVPVRSVYVLDGADDLQSFQFQGSSSLDLPIAAISFETAHWGGSSDRDLVAFEHFLFGEHAGETKVEVVSGGPSAIPPLGTWYVKPLGPVSPGIEYVGYTTEAGVLVSLQEVDTNVPLNINADNLTFTLEGNHALATNGAMTGTIQLQITEQSGYQLDDGGVMVGQIQIVLTDEGEILILPGGEIDVDLPIDLEGASVFIVDAGVLQVGATIDIGSGAVFNAQGGQVAAAVPIQAVGTLLLGGSTQFVADVDLTGVLAGIGAIDGDLVIGPAGDVLPGTLAVSSATPAQRRALGYAPDFIPPPEMGMPTIGSFTVNALTVESGASITLDLAGTGSGQYDKIVVAGGPIDLNGGTLNLGTTGLMLPDNRITELVLIENQGSAPVDGIFDGRPEGFLLSSDFAGSGFAAFLTYAGGDGNDIAVVTGPFQVVGTGAGGNPNALVSLDSLTFNQAVDAGSVTPGSIITHAAQQGRTEAPTASVAGTTVSLTQEPTYRPGELVEVTVTSQIDSTVGKSARGQVFSFYGKAGVGTGEFAFAESGSQSTGGDLSLGDLNGDGHVDVFGINPFDGFYVSLNNGLGEMSAGDQESWSSSLDSVRYGELADVDGDGDLDGVVWSQSAGVFILNNDGTGNFTQPVAAAIPGDGIFPFTFDLAIGDLDADGDLDIVLSEDRTDDGDRGTVFLNNGAGTFLATGEDFSPNNTDSNGYQKVSLVDADADGDLDVVLSQGFHLDDLPDVLLLNDGTGAFSGELRTLKLGGSGGSGQSGETSAKGDVNGDGYWDLIVVNGTQSRLYFGSAGGFTSGNSLDGIISGDFEDFVLGDVDGDGDLDLAAIPDSSEDGAGRLFLNNGAGLFSDSGQRLFLPAGPMVELVPGDMEFADVDGDGDLDIVLSSQGNLAVMINADPLPARIGNFVWDDVNRNGIQDSGEKGVRVPGGVTVNLWSAGVDGQIGGGDDAQVATTQTNKFGVYTFEDLLPGDYYLQYVLPAAGYAFSPARVGNWKSDSNADPATGLSEVFSVMAGETDFTRDAGMLAPGRIGDHVWIDDDGDGAQDAGETGARIPGGMTVHLFNAGPDQETGGGDDVFVATTLTNKWGVYLFEPVDPGRYFVQFVLPDGYAFTQQNPSVNWKKDSDADPLDGTTTAFNLSANKTDRSRDAGLVLAAPARVVAVVPTEAVMDPPAIQPSVFDRLSLVGTHPAAAWSPMPLRPEDDFGSIRDELYADDFATDTELTALEIALSTAWDSAASLP